MITTPSRFDLSVLHQTLLESESPSVFTTGLAIQEILSRSIYPMDKVSRRFDFLFHEFQARYGLLEDGLEAISILNGYLFEDLQFKVITEDKCAVEDYFIGKVLESKQSSPLTMAIIYRELANRISQGPLFGTKAAALGRSSPGMALATGSVTYSQAPVNFVNFPGLALIKLFYNHQLLFINPAEGGTLLSVSELQSKLHGRYGQNVSLSSSFLETPSESHVINRLLTKLKNMYFDLRQWENLLGVLDLLVWLNPTKMHELKERGLLLYQLGHTLEAKSDLTRFVSHARPSAETEKIKQLVTYLENPKITPLYD